MLSRSTPRTAPGPNLPLHHRRAIDGACDRFEAAWKSGDRPGLSTFLEAEDETPRDRLFEELFALELELRAYEGDRPEPEEYLDRFPEFRTVIEKAFAPAGTGQTTIESGAEVIRPGRSRVERLAASEDAVAEAFAGAGYTILGVLGRGGMGVVYEAAQAKLGRVVALKVIRASHDPSDEIRRRFAREAEAVARLDHSQIVPIHEVGQAGGFDYFSMKRIKGAGLDTLLANYAGDHLGSARLVATVAEAIDHAHRRGILHRDLKPANILIDDRGEPHVTDFGLARDVEFSDELTRTGQIVGTPAYMAPEQAEGDRGGVTTASDVYGLGGVLYALLTGRAPHIGDSLFETLEKVRNGSPEPPSRQDPKVPRDLDVICLKCLEIDPARRYESAQALADDLRRWLRGEPILARPVGRAVRMALWCRRHPLPTSLAFLLALALATGSAGITWKWREAEREAATAAEVLGALRRIFATPSDASNPGAASITVRELLDRESAKVGSHFQGRPRVEADVRSMIGDSYLALDQPRQALDHFQEAVRLNREQRGPDDPTSLHSSIRLAVTLARVGRAEEAETLARATLDASDRAQGPTSSSSIEAADELGWLLREAGQAEEAEPWLRRALEARRRTLIPDHPETLRSVHRLCLLDLDRHRYDEADKLAFEYERAVRCALGPDHPANIEALRARGQVSKLRGRPVEAEAFYRRAVEEARRIFGDDHPVTSSAEADHARVALLGR